MSRNKVEKLLSCAGAVLCVLALFCACYFIAWPMRGYFNSDYADTLTWAKASVDAKALFSHDFTYACLLPFGGQLLMMPFVALFGYTYTAQACGMILFLLLFALALGALFRALGANLFWTGLTLFCVIGALCSSEKLREVYFGHILYYSLGALFLMVGLTLVLSLEKDKNNKFPWRTVGFCAWCVLCSADGLTSLTLFVLPLCAALAFERLCDKQVKFLSNESFERARPLFFALVFSIGGLGLGALLRHGFEAPYQEAFSTFSTEMDWAANLELVLPSFLCLFTGSVDMYLSFTSFSGITTALRLLFGLAVMAAPIVSLFFWKHLNRGEKLLVVSHFTVSATMLFAFVFGLLSNATWRLSPMLFTALLVTLCLIRRLAVTPFFKRFALLAMAFCVLVAGLGLLDVIKMKPDYTPVGSAADLTHYLKAEGFTHGYSTFWNANAITVLSNGDVACRNVSVDENTGTLTADYYQSEKAWYKNGGVGERNFLLLTEAEHTAFMKTAPSYVLDVHSYHGYCILSLAYDPFASY